MPKGPMPKLIVTTSWDDGDIADVRLSELLLECGVRATFYVPIHFHGRPAGVSRELRGLAHGGFEIGAHSVNHVTLSAVSAAQVRSEVWQSKSALEQTLGLPVRSFCYPGGRYNATVLREVQQAGYIGARTTRMLYFGIQSPFEMPTTLQAYPHGMSAYLKNLCRGRNLAGLGDYARMAPGASGWVEFGKRLFDMALINGGIWHLYGHSWEIEQLNLWSELKQLLSYVGHRAEAFYATNSEAICFWQSQQEAGLEDRACA